MWSCQVESLGNRLQIVEKEMREKKNDENTKMRRNVENPIHERVVHSNNLK